MSPKISICLPNLNNRRFLPERLQTIFEQTFNDWELVVVDNHSDDGAWEYLSEQAKREPRMRLSQAPRAGMYANWNNCLRLARGEYVYIATSDDTLRPDCLEKMVAALEQHPECGLCQCGLKVIDEQGEPHAWMRWENFAFGRFAAAWLQEPQIRRAPLDGLLHFVLQTVYTSITQLLIRRRVFDRVGLFETCWGSVGDFEWGMRTGLLEDCVFIPGKLATWRVHDQQATTTTESIATRRKLQDMARVAFERAQRVPGNKLAGLPANRLFQFYREQIVLFGLREAANRPRQLAFLLGEMLRGNSGALEYLFSRRRAQLFQEPAQFDALNALLKEHNIPAPLFLASATPGRF